MTIDPAATLITVGACAGTIATLWSLLARSRRAFRASVEETVEQAIREVHRRIDDHMNEEERQLAALTAELNGIREALLALLVQNGTQVVVLPPPTKEARP